MESLTIHLMGVNINRFDVMLFLMKFRMVIAGILECISPTAYHT